MKRVWALLLTALFLNIYSTAWAAEKVVASGSCGEDVTWTLDDSGLLTISGSGAMADYSSDEPAPWDEYSDAVETIEIESGVTSIGKYAFCGCDSLSSVTVPDSVTSIGKHAFSYCTSLTSVTIPDSVTSIGGRAFYHCYDLTSIDVANGNTVYASQDGVLFNKDMTELVAYPGGQAGAYTIPDSVTSIGDGAFEYCEELTSVTIPDSVTSIGDYAFLESGLTSSVTIPDGVTSIGWAVFAGSNLTSISIPNGVTSIGKYAFAACRNLRSVTIPDSVTSIGDYAFEDCFNSVTIFSTPASDIYYTGTAEQWNAILIGSGNSALNNANIHFSSIRW